MGSRVKVGDGPPLRFSEDFGAVRDNIRPKVQLQTLSAAERGGGARCVRDDNITALTKVPGIGKKTAERLVIELRDRLKNWDMPQSDLLAHSEIQSIASDNDVFAEAESALIALGYKPVDAAKMISLAAKQKPDAKSEELIRMALRAIAG